MAQDIQKELEDFLQHVCDEHTDQYGHLEITSEDSEFGYSIKTIVKDYLDKK